MNILSSYIVIILLVIMAMFTPADAARQFGIRRSNNAKIQPTAFVSSGVSIDSSVQDTITSEDLLIEPRSSSSSSPPKRPRQVLSAAMVACISGVVIGGARQLCEVAGIVI